MIDVSKEELEDRVKKAMKDIAPFLAKIMDNPEIMMPDVICAVCNKTRKQDLVSHGSGVSVFVYHPCKHRSDHRKGQPVRWYENGNDCPVLEIDTEED